MRISTKDWLAFVGKLSQINQAAADEIRSYVAKNGFADTQALISYCYHVADYYGTASASLSALMYDTIAELEGVALPAAELAASPTYGDVAKAVNGTLKTSQNPDEIAGSVSRLVKMAGQDTMLFNAQRDGAEFAWIPSGDTCAFCIMLASRGWQNISKATLRNGHADHIHSNCDCTYMVRHSSDFDVRGYDPDKYLREYNDADGSNWKDKLNAMRRDRYAENADEINAQKREAYALRMHPKTETERQKLEAQARQAYIANGGHAGLSALEASERFDKLIDAQTDAQLRKYISRHK